MNTGNTSPQIDGTTRRQREFIVARLLMALALLIVAVAAATLWRHGFGELFQDQFRIYRWVFEVGLPQVLFQRDNEHRLVFSSVVRWLELHLAGGDQRLGILSGLVAMVTTWMLIVREAWREAGETGLRAAAVALLGAVALFWAGAARLQFHGNETLQVFIVIAMALLANRMVSDDRRSPVSRWILAILAGFIALLSFGFGMAVFAGMISLAVVLGRRASEVLAAIAATAVALVVYLFVLPGGDAVRGNLSFELWPILTTAVTWLGSAVVVAWLGLGLEGLFGVSPERIAEAGMIGGGLVRSSEAVTRALGIGTPASAAFVAGTCGLLVLAVLMWRVWRAPQRAGAIERMGLGLALFAAAAAGLVAIGRFEYFRLHPGQLLADRYVLWTSVFWFGILTAAMARWRPAPLVALALVLPILLLPSHQIGVGWASAVGRGVEARAAEAQAGVRTEGWLSFADLPDMAAVDDSLAFYRESHLAMFRLPRARALGEVLNLATLVQEDIPAVEWWEHGCIEVLHLGSTGETAWHVSGVISRRHAPDEGLLALDAAGRVVGLGEFGFEIDGALFRRGETTARGFDLFLAPGIEPSREGLRLYLADGPLTRLVPLTTVPCREAGGGSPVN